MTHRRRMPSRTALAASIAIAVSALTPARGNGFILVDETTCHLADAITAANDDAAVNGCPPGLGDDIVLLISDATLAAQLPAVTSNVAFEGAAGVTITGDGVHRLFMIGDETHSPTVSFHALTLQGGIAQGGEASDGAGGGAGLGGAMFVYDGNVTVDSVTFSMNAASGGDSTGAPTFTGTNNYIGTGGGGGGGMFGAGGSGADSDQSPPASVNGSSGGTGGFGGGGGGGGLTYSEAGGSGGNGGDGGEGGAGGIAATSGGAGSFGGGGGGGGAAVSGTSAQPGGAGGFGGGGGGGAGNCIGYASCAGSDGGAGAPGGFGGGGGAGGSFSGNKGGAGGDGGFAGGGGTNGGGESSTGVGVGGFGAGSAVYNQSGNGGGGGGGGLGGAVFVRSGTLDVRNSVFDSNSASGGASASAEAGFGLGGALFALDILANANGNDQGMPSLLPTITGCANTFSGNTAGDAGTANNDNADVFGADRVGLVLACGDRVFADGFDPP